MISPPIFFIVLAIMAVPVNPSASKSPKIPIFSFSATDLIILSVPMLIEGRLIGFFISEIGDRKNFFAEY